MGKRLTRIFSHDLSSHRDKLLNREINLVLRNKATIYGKLQSISGNNWIVRDLIARVHSIPQEEISELIYDQEAAY